MADREDQPPAPPAGLSADEAERLSEKFHPSWEEPAGDELLAATTPAEPRRAIKQTLVGGVSPVARQPPLAATPPARSAPATNENETRRAGPSRPPAQTLVGIAPVSSPPPLPKATTSSPVTAGGTPDGPTGIAKIYRPKDDPSGPAVLLTEEVQQAEAATAAELEARRRDVSSRRTQTVVNLKAPDLPGPAPARPKRRSGVWQLLLGVVAGVVVVAAVFKLTTRESGPAELSPSSAETEQAQPEGSPASALPSVAPSAAETAGPVVTPVAPAEESSSRPVVLPAESVDRAAEPGDTVSRRPRSKPATVAPAPAAKKPAPKPSKPTAKDPASSPPASKGGVIVRDSPF